MRTLIAALVLVVVTAAPACADTYQVTVLRIDSNLYRDSSSKTLIQTRYCHEYAHSDDAVLPLRNELDCLQQRHEVRCCRRYT